MSMLSANVFAMLRQQVLSWFVTPGVHIIQTLIDPLDVAAFHASHRLRSINAIDDQTWSDLHGNHLVEHLCTGASSYAHQVCHNRLREPADRAVVNLRTAYLQALADDAKSSEEFRKIFASLRQGSSRSFIRLFDEGTAEAPAHPNWLRSARVWPFVLGVGLLIVNQTAIGFALMAISVVGTLYVQMKFHAAMFLFERLTDEILNMLAVAMRLVSHQSLHQHPCMNKLCEQAADVRLMARVFHAAAPAGRFSVVEEYANWLTLKNVRNYLKLHPVAQQRKKWFLNLFENLGELELMVTLAARRRSDRHAFGQVEWSSDHRVTFEGLTHPLVSEFHPLDIDTAGRSVLITGENGAGKSTAIRAAAVSILFARAFGFSFARSAGLPFRTLITSLQVNDHLLEGESLFYAEVRRAREMCQATDNEVPPILFFDEVFRGTSRKESISIGIALLESLSEKSIVFATTHHRELVAILGGRFDLLLCSRMADKDAIRFGIGKGSIDKPNALAVFRNAGFDSAMVSRAEAVFQSFEASRI